MRKENTIAFLIARVKEYPAAWVCEVLEEINEREGLGLYTLLMADYHIRLLGEVLARLRERAERSNPKDTPPAR